MSLRVMMIPAPDNMRGHAESGIKRLVEKLALHLPAFDIELVNEHAISFDVVVIHAGMSNRFDVGGPIVSCVAGWYWDGDYHIDQWQAKANGSVTNSVRHSTAVVVPSEWVGMCLKRDMHVTPFVVPHGTDWQEWQGDADDGGYVLWAKNRGGVDACDPRPVVELAQRFPETRFLTTFAPDNPTPNVKVTGAVPHAEMKKMIMESVVYLSSAKETFGITTLESMSAGKPILGFDWGGNRDLVKHGVNGYLSRQGDFHELAEGLNYVMAHRKTLGENSREMAKQWTWEKACEKFVEVLRYAVDSWRDVHSRPFTIDESLYRVSDAV